MEINDVIKLIKSANTIALFSHINPDCDTICSALALKAFLVKVGKTVSAFCDGDLKREMNDLYSADSVNADTPSASYDLTIAIDCAAEDRLGKYRTLFKKCRRNLCIDHHLQDRNYAAYNFIDAKAGATAELIYLIMKTWDESLIDKDIAALIYTALVTDTGNFAYSNVGVRTMNIASAMLSYGIPNADISFEHFRAVSRDTFLLKTRVFSKIRFFEDNKIAVVSFMQEDFQATGTTVSNSSNLVSDIANIAGVEIAVSITEVKPNAYKVSIRTHKDADANAIAMTFGGGGHKNAAGFMTNGFYGNVLDDILKACKDNL